MTSTPRSETTERPAAPRQERSRDKLERVLAATDALLCERLFEDIAMADIAAKAGVAVGTIYTRFRKKDDLLPALFARHDESVAATLRAFLEGLGRKRTLRARIEGIVNFAVDYHLQHRGLLRALTMYVRAHPDSVPAKTFQEREGQYRAVGQAVVGDGRGILHKDPLQAVEFALALLNSVCREQLLFDEVSPLREHRSNLAAFKRRLTDTIHRDLAARVR